MSRQEAAQRRREELCKKETGRKATEDCHKRCKTGSSETALPRPAPRCASRLASTDRPIADRTNEFGAPVLRHRVKNGVPDEASITCFKPLWTKEFRQG